MPLCSSCASIDLRALVASFLTPIPFKPSFGELETSAQAGCRLCLLVKSVIESASKSGNAKTPEKAVYYAAIGTGDKKAPLLSALLVSCMGRSGSLILAPVNVSSGPSGIVGRSIPPMPDLSPQSWAWNVLSNCIKNHPECNNMLSGDPRPNEPYMPPKVYDIVDKRLKLGRDIIDDQYAALSYVWGRSSALWNSRTLKGNVQARLKKLETDDFPRTYITAIEIAQTLNLRYIWIDSLCIEQDNPDDQKDNFTNHMSNIYQNAQVAIVSIKDSADGDCLTPRTVAGTQDQASFVSDTIYAIKRVGNSEKDIGGEGLTGPLWSNRGWTFQERLLPPRCLYFTGTQIYYECRRNLLEETGIQHLTSIYKRLDYSHGANTQRAQLLKAWPAMVRDYSKRALGYEADRIPAILGAAAVIGDPNVDWVVKCGLFPNRLTTDLLWEADSQPLRAPDLPNGRPSDLPTWSWGHWMGKVGWETYLETSKPRLEIIASKPPPPLPPIGSAGGQLILKTPKILPIRVGANVPSPSSSNASTPSWLVFSLQHQNVFDLLFPTPSGPDVIKGWGVFDTDPTTDVDSKKLFCVFVSEAVDDDGGHGSGIKRCANILLVDIENDGQGNTCRRRGIGMVTGDEGVFDDENVKALRWDLVLV